MLPAKIVTPTRENELAPASVAEAASGWDKVLAEFQASAVSDKLTQANIKILQGQPLLEELTQYASQALGGHSTQYVTQAVQKIIQKYEAVAEGGGWVCYGQTLDGSPGAVPVIKPFKPRTVSQGTGFGENKIKTLKYENPLKAPGNPILPTIPEEFIQRIESRWGVTLRRDIPLWQAVKETPELPIAVTEGVKKALALVDQGIPAIAVRGVTMWRRVGTDELCPELEAFADKGRRVFLFFDQDDRPKTRKQVFGEAVKLSKEFERHRCDFRIVTWHLELGKGIDDVLVAMPEGERWEWLEQALQEAPTLAQFRRKEISVQVLERLREALKLPHPAERETQGRYIPQLPPLSKGAIHALVAPTGSGKSVRIGKDWIKPWVSQRDHFVIVLSPLNSLGQQAAKQWDIPHIHSFGDTPDGNEGLEATMRAKGGIILCPDSLPRLPTWIWNQNILLVLDEANQVCKHITDGNTLGDRWSDINGAFAQLALKAEALVAAEANLTNETLKLLQAISQKQQIRLFVHQAQDRDPWPVRFYTGHICHNSGFFADLLEVVERGEKIAFFTSSKFAGKRLEALLKNSHLELKIERIDSDTNEGVKYAEFFENPDRWLLEQQPDVLICSPSVKSGVSIQGNVPASEAYFQSVWGYFPSGTGDLHYQLLGRFRPAVPRFVYCPTHLLSESDEEYSAEKIKKNLQEQALALAQALGVSSLLEIQDQQIEAIQDAVFEFYCQSAANRAAQKWGGADYLAYLLSQDKHNVTFVPLKANTDMKEYLQQARKRVEEQEAQALARAQVGQGMTLEWAHRVLHSQTSYETRCQARKVLLKHNFPGVNFDDAAICRKAVVEHYGAMLQGVQLHGYAENLGATQQVDAERLREILQKPLKALHKMPKHLIQSKLIVQLGILNLIGKSYSNSMPEVQRVKETALRYRQLIWRHLRLNIQPDQSPVHIVNKLFRRLALEPKAVARPADNNRERIYEVAPNPLRDELLEAFRNKLAGKSRPPFPNGENLIQNCGQTVSTDSPPPASPLTTAVQNPNPPPPKKPQNP